MFKKIIAVLVAALMIMALMVGCKDKPNDDESSIGAPTNSVVSVPDEDEGDDWEDESSDIADDEGDDWGDDWEDWGDESSDIADAEDEDDFSGDYDWTLNTSSAFYRDDPAATK